MQKKLKPSFREHKRYLRISGKKPEIEKAILDFIGIFGYSKAGIMFIKPGILAVNRESVNYIKASLNFAGIRVSKVSGTLKGLGK